MPNLKEQSYINSIEDYSLTDYDPLFKPDKYSDLTHEVRVVHNILWHGFGAVREKEGKIDKAH
jgi:hypothetical protein